MFVSESLEDIFKPKELNPKQQDEWDELKWRQEQQRKIDHYSRDVLQWMMKLGMPKRQEQNINFFMGEIQTLFHNNIPIIQKAYMKDTHPRDLAEFLLRQL